MFMASSGRMYFPVINDVTEYEVWGVAQYARSKRAPRAAMASMLGVVRRA